MSKDPAFLFYPGDASEDTQFMNRLERGCYFDLLKAQKKFEKFTLEQIKKVLGNDFASCWPSIELVLKKEGDFYFIEWVAEKIEQRKFFSESRRKNRKSKTSDKYVLNISLSSDDDMVNGNGVENENVIKNEVKGVQGETFETRFERTFNDMKLDELKCSFPDLDIPAELNHFRIKCNSAKSDYHTRDPDGLRLGFLKQLEHSPNKKKTNGRNGKKHEFRDEEILS